MLNDATRASGVQYNARHNRASFDTEAPEKGGWTDTGDYFGIVWEALPLPALETSRTKGASTAKKLGFCLPTPVSLSSEFETVQHLNLSRILAERK